VGFKVVTFIIGQNLLNFGNLSMTLQTLEVVTYLTDLKEVDNGFNNKNPSSCFMIGDSSSCLERRGINFQCNSPFLPLLPFQRGSISGLGVAL